jgi:hypothetical protein
VPKIKENKVLVHRNEGMELKEMQDNYICAEIAKIDFHLKIIGHIVCHLVQ